MVIETYYGKINASKDTLNELSRILNEASKSFYNRGFMEKASLSYNESYKIYSELRKAGYYNK